MRLIRPFGCLLGDKRGSMAIETAIVAPVLVLMSLGGFEVSSMVARQSELQSAAAEAASIVRAMPTDESVNTTTIRDIIKASTGITDNNKVTVVEIYRCGTDADYVDAESDCATGTFASKFVSVTIQDTYNPVWTNFGVGEPLDYNVQRTVQVSTEEES